MDTPAPPPAPPAPPAPPQNISASVDISSKNMNPPRYPPAAVRAGIEGTVILIIDVDATGNVVDVSVERSSRNRDLDRAAIAAARQWRFTPSDVHGPKAPAPPRPPAPPAPPQNISASVDISSKNMNPPRYPPAAVRAGIEGTVILIIDVDANGNVVDVSVERSSRNRDLDRAAIAAARKWRFNPSVVNGQKAAGRVRVPVDFTLGG